MARGGSDESDLATQEHERRARLAPVAVAFEDRLWTLDGTLPVEYADKRRWVEQQILVLGTYQTFDVPQVFRMDLENGIAELEAIVVETLQA